MTKMHRHHARVQHLSGRAISHDMADTAYRVIPTPLGGYHVERTKQGQPPEVTGDFGSRGAAFSWIDQDKEQMRPPRQWWRFWSSHAGRR